MLTLLSTKSTLNGIDGPPGMMNSSGSMQYAREQLRRGVVPRR